MSAYDPLDADSIRGFEFGGMLHTLELRGVLSHEAVELLQAAHDSSVMAEARAMLEDETPGMVDVTVANCDACPFAHWSEQAGGIVCTHRGGPPLGDETPGYEDGHGIPDACPLRAAPVRVEVAT